MNEKYNFSKPADQARFDELDEAEKKRVADSAAADAFAAADLIKKGEVQDFEQAIAKLEAERARERESIACVLREILDRQLTIENIDEFADQMLDSLMEFTTEQREKYRAAHPETKLDQKALEDAAFAEYGLTDVEKLLDAAATKVERLKRLDEFIEGAETIDRVITPPSVDRFPNNHGSHGSKENGTDRLIIPRIKTLLYILETDFGVNLSEIGLKKGIITETMIRRRSYATVEVPQLARIVQVCDEEGNASYVFDSAEMSKLNLSVDKLNDLTKEQKNELLKLHPRLGRRVVQTKKWRDQMAGLLSIIEPVEMTDQGDREKLLHATEADLKRVSLSELDEWRGFWTDPATGKHWGPIGLLANRLGISFVMTKKNTAGAPGLAIIDQVGKRNIGFCFEDIKPGATEHLALPVAEKTGEWAGFYTDETGKHWGPINRLASKTGLSFDYLSGLSDKLNGLKMIDMVGRHAEGYCYEDLIEFEPVKTKFNYPRVEKEGEWRGFWIDPATGKHWASAHLFKDRIGMSHAGAKKRLSKMPTVTVLDLSGKTIPTYCIEDYMISDKAYLELPVVAEEGEWAGFHTDKDGRHWAPIAVIAAKIGVSDSVVKKRSLGLPNLLVVDSRGKENKGAHCYEDVLPLFADSLLLPKVESEGEWRGFHIDKAGNHWAALGAIERKLGRGKGFIEPRLTPEMKTIEAIDTGGNRITAYCYEKLLAELGDKAFAPKVAKEGGWAGFYTDKDGRHWAPVTTLARKLDRDRSVITSRLKTLASIEVVDNSGKDNVAYCYEELEGRFLDKDKK
jgi:hypothetical protein